MRLAQRALAARPVVLDALGHELAVRMAQRAAQVADHALRILVAVARLLLQRFLDDELHRAADVRLLPDGPGRLHQMHHRHGYRRLALKGDVTGEHLVENHAYGIQVAGAGGAHALGLFGREIVHRAHDVAVGGQRLGVGQAGNAKIADLHLPASGDHDVLGLHVPVDDAALVRVRERCEDAQRTVHRLLLLHFALLGDDVLECVTVDILKRNI